MSDPFVPIPGRAANEARGGMKQEVQVEDLTPAEGSGPLDGLRRFRPSLEILLLVGVVALFFGRYLVTGRVLLMRDLFVFWYPRYTFHGEILRTGHLALWNPYTGCGEHFLANMQMGALYPVNLLYAFVPAGATILLSTMFHMLLMAVGLFALCRHWQLSRQGALLAAVAFCFSTQIITRVEFYPFFVGLSWFPVVFLLYAQWLKQRRVWRLSLTALAMAMQWLAGYPEAALYTDCALGLYAIFVAVAEARAQRSPRALLAPIAGLAAAVAVSACLAMPQLLPAWEASKYAVGRGGPANPRTGMASINPLMLLTFFYPSAYGVPGYGGPYWAPSCYEYWVGAFHIGLVPVALLIAALVVWISDRSHTRAQDAPQRLLHRRRRKNRDRSHTRAQDAPLLRLTERRILLPFLLVLFILPLLYSMGKYTPVFAITWRALPVLQKFRWPAKTMFCAVMALCVMAGFAYDSLRAKPADPASGNAPRRSLGWQLVLIVMAILSLGALLCMAQGGRLGTALLERLFDMPTTSPRAERVPWGALKIDAWRLAIVPLAVGVLLWISHRRLRYAGAIRWVLIAVAFADLALVGARLLPTAESKLLTKTSQLLSKLSGVGASRFYEPNTETQYIYGITDVRRFENLRDLMVGSWPLVDHAYNIEPFGDFALADVRQASGACSSKNLTLLGCTVKVAIRKLENARAWDPIVAVDFVRIADALPRALVVGGAILEPDQRATFAAMHELDFDPYAATLVSMPDAAGWRFDDLKVGRVRHVIKKVQDVPNGIILEVESEAPGLLVLNDAWFPGWKAKVNGQPAPVLKVNGAFRAVRIPAGGSVVTMAFWPRPLTTGLLVAAAVAALMAVAVFVTLRKPTNG